MCATEEVFHPAEGGASGLFRQLCVGFFPRGLGLLSADKGLGSLEPGAYGISRPETVAFIMGLVLPVVYTNCCTRTFAYHRFTKGQPVEPHESMPVS